MIPIKHKFFYCYRGPNGRMASYSGSESTRALHLRQGGGKTDESAPSGGRPHY